MIGEFRSNLVHIGALVNLLPADYWQEENTLDYFIEEETGLILTLEDL
jgi:hypothetical protein